jgi:enolase
VRDSAIRRVHARQIYDSRGRPTLEADVALVDGSLGRAAVPAGASTGVHEAHELRDGDPAVYGGLGVLRAVSNVDDVLGPALAGMDARDQPGLDARMREIDASPGLQRLGANAVLGISMAACRAAARSAGVALYRHLAELAGVTAPSLPLPMVNVLSGGAHAQRGMDVQDFLAMPIGAASLDEALAMAARVRTAAGRLIAEEGGVLLLADEGGFAPGYATVDQALELMVRAIERAGLRPGLDVGIGMDVAATQFVQAAGSAQTDHGPSTQGPGAATTQGPGAATTQGPGAATTQCPGAASAQGPGAASAQGPGAASAQGAYVYELRREGLRLSSTAMAERMLGWLARYPVVSVEDPLGEDDWDAWQDLTRSVAGRCQLVGDDLFCTNPRRIARGIQAGVANAVLIKLNQIGTVSDTLAALSLAQSAGYRAVVSARSGETEDPFIADLAVGTAAGQIKIGSLANSERLSKYNQLVRIEEELGVAAFKNPLK